MNVFNLLAKIGLDTSEYDSGLSRIASGVGKATKVVGAAVAAGTAVVTKFGADAIAAGQDFDKAMAQVAATSGKTMEQLNSEIQTTMIGTEEFTGTLREFAQYMGSTTAFSATEAADALNYMALAGYDAKTSMDMLPTVLNLAAAGNMDLAAASDMVTDAQTALGLSIPETAKMVDEMARASAKSNTSVAQLGEAFLTIGANAKGLSGGTNELSTALGILADNGIKGSEGGTKLRNIMLSLASPTKEANDFMLQFGTSIHDVMYDANGEMRPLVEVFGDLNSIMADMDSSQRTEMISTLFNKQDIAAATALLDTQVQRWNGLSTSIMASKGAADKMAKTQLDNLAGDITLFQSALEGARIAVSDQLTPAIREFVQFGADGLGQLTQAFQADGLSGAMEKFGELLSTMLNKVIEMLPQMINAGMRLLGALGQGILDNLPVVIDSAIQVVGMLANMLLNPENVAKLQKAGFDILFRLADAVIESLPTLIPAVMEIIMQIVNTLFDPENVSRLINSALDIIICLAEGIIENVDQLIAAVFTIITSITTYLTNPENIGKLVETAIRLVIAIGVGLIKAIPQLAISVTELAGSIAKTIRETDWLSIGKNIVDGILKGLKNAWSSLTKWFSESISKLVSGVKNILGIESPSKVFAGIGGYMAEGLGVGWDDEIDDVKKTINSDLDFNATPVTATGTIAQPNNVAIDAESLTEAVKNALDSYEIKWDDRNLGRLVRTYA